ncbi:immunoglobulin-like domain-containing protein [Ligilactobacillus ruminis]|uniref:immunoglobulin-like domain-containing protein n=1 Tax=Ligilactobacillus ruminis TaxID=1623 RepID=UPI001EE07A60|nr:immunoglobulin-like domain-containing protein [Ligilactobacillus ruminis]
MKQRGLMKRVGAVLMAAALTISTFPQIHTNVYATENQLPTKEQFATVDELRNFDTNDGTENKAAKVYFGNNNQQWWIAGSQDGNLTLFATAPVLENQRFNGDSHKSDTQKYDLTWNCDYEDVNPENNEVYVNHYGGSKMRQAILKEVEDLLFTAKEKEYINTTPIYTNDNKNYNWQYKTNDRLYLANMDSSNNTLYVGKTIRYTYDTGLRIDESYFKNINDFWTRRPGRRLSPKDVVVVSNGQRVIRNIYDQYAVVPAFELNLSSAIFASAAPAATSDGKLSENDAFTLRYQSQKDIGEAAISKSKENIAVTNVKNENTYLVVQNSQGAWSKKVSSNDLVFASDIDSSLTSFENCKVWLETTSDRITYAKEATQGSGHNVKVNIGENLIINGGNILQTNVSGNITEITIKVNDGYYLPDGYTDTIYGLNGLNVKDVTQTSFTISGTPTSDVNITLPAATVLPKSAIPEVTISKTKASITATVTNHKTKFGDIEYKWNDGKWEQNKNTLSNLQADTTYKLAVRFTGKGIYQPSDEYSVDITTLKDGNTVIVVPTGLTTTYKEGLKLSEIAFPADSGWSWVDGNAALSAGTKSYPASFDTTRLESTTDFSNVEGYDPNTHKVTKNVEVKVDKADSAVNITTQSLNKAYDGNAVSVPEYTTSGSDGKVTTKWQENTGSADAPKWEDLKSAPSKVGTYRVVIELAGNDNYKHASATLDFTISKADNAWAKELSIKGWKYNETANVPSATAKYGDVVYTYSDSKDGTYTSEVPKNAGTYYVKATVAGTENYTGLESVVPFKIAKADTTLAFEKDNIDKIYDRNVISEPKVNKTGSSNDITFAWFVANGNDWTLLDNAPSDVGAYKVVVSAKEDTNYNGASIEKEFSISMADNEWTKKLSIKGWTYGEKPSVPSATAKYGDVVYTYSDSKDGTYTSEVPKNAGTYYVKASVAGTENYTVLESAPVAFEIAKAIPSYEKVTGEKVTGLVLGQGQALSKIELPEQFKWVDETMTADELGTHTFKAIYTPEDTANYQTIEVKVVPTPVAINHVPTINASDKTITVGDKFEPLKDVIANDKEDGDLTSKIKVIKNTVDTKKAGTYEVTYQVTDSQGATVTKTIKVTVKTAPVNPDKDKPNNDKGNVETRDQTNVGLFTTLSIISALGIAILAIWKKKR